MANTLPSLTVMSDIALPALQTKAPLLSAFATNISSGVADRGTAVFTTYMGATTASLWAGTFAPGDNTITGVTCTFQEPFYRSIGLSPNEQNSYDEATLANRFIVPMVNDVIGEVLKKTYAVLDNNASIIAWSGSAGAFGFNAAQSGSKILDQSGSMGQAVALLGVTADYSLQADLKENYASAQYIMAGNVNAGYRAGKVIAFPAYGFPTTNGNDGVICSPDAVAVATRVPSQPNSVERALITDPLTGLTVALDRWEDPTLGKTIYAVKLSAGVVAGRPGMVARLKA